PVDLRIRHPLSSSLPTPPPPPSSTLSPTRRSSDLRRNLRPAPHARTPGRAGTDRGGRAEKGAGPQPGRLDRVGLRDAGRRADGRDRKSTRLNSSHVSISYAVFCLKKKTVRAMTDKE